MPLKGSGERRVLTDVNTSLCANDRKDTVARLGISPHVVFATLSCEYTNTDLTINVKFDGHNATKALPPTIGATTVGTEGDWSPTLG